MDPEIELQRSLDRIQRIRRGDAPAVKVTNDPAKPLTTLQLLQKYVVDMGGQVIASAGRSVGFALTDSSGRHLFKLVADGDSVVLHQLSGAERGQSCEVATLSFLQGTAK